MNAYRGIWRGKLKCDTKPYKKGEWIEGNYMSLDNNNPAILPHIYGYGEVEVEADTLGECTCLYDKNGTLIFEGDIIEHKGERYVIKYIEKYMRFSPVKPGTVFAVFDYTQSVIIGNIHDNPEMLNATGDDIGNAAQDTLAPAT